MCTFSIQHHCYHNSKPKNNSYIRRKTITVMVRNDRKRFLWITDHIVSRIVDHSSYSSLKDRETWRLRRFIRPCVSYSIKSLTCCSVDCMIVSKCHSNKIGVILWNVIIVQRWEIQWGPINVVIGNGENCKYKHKLLLDNKELKYQLEMRHTILTTGMHF
jgi:hypothetical protein